MKKLFLLLLLACDFGSKWWAIRTLPLMGGIDQVYPFGGMPVFSGGGMTCSLNYAANTGAAWGLFQGYSGVLFGLRVTIITGLILYLIFRKREFPLWLIVTGAIGNAIDYALYGHVVDFLHFTFGGKSFPIFNLADTWITLGALAQLVFVRREKRQHSEHTSVHS